MLRIGLPSKCWEDEVLRFLGQNCGLRVDRSNPRQYRARMTGLPTGPTGRLAVLISLAISASLGSLSLFTLAVT